MGAGLTPAPFLTPLEREAAAAYMARVARALGHRLVRVIVFGSRARGEGHEESDLDLAVVVEGDETDLFRPVFDLAAGINLEYEYAVRLSPLLISENRLNEYYRRELGIARAILDEGFPL